MTQELQQIVAQWRYVPDSAELRVCAICNIKADAGLCGSCAQAWAAKLPILAQQLLESDSRLARIAAILNPILARNAHPIEIPLHLKGELQALLEGT